MVEGFLPCFREIKLKTPKKLKTSNRPKPEISISADSDLAVGMNDLRCVINCRKGYCRQVVLDRILVSEPGFGSLGKRCGMNLETVRAVCGAMEWQSANSDINFYCQPFKHS